MANSIPSQVFLVVGGKDVTGDVYSLSDTVEQVYEETHSFGDSWEEHSPVGIAKVTVETGEGLYDDRTAGVLAAFQDTPQTRQLVSWGYVGNAAAAAAYMIDGKYSVKWSRMAKRDGITLGQAEHVMSGIFYNGTVTSGLTSRSGATGNTQSASSDGGTSGFGSAITITSSTAATEKILTSTSHSFATGDRVLIAGHSGSTPDINGYHTITVVDADEFTLDGIDITVGGTGGTATRVSGRTGIADFHCTALSLGGYTNATVVLQHSDDNSTWATLATFTAVTAAGSSQRSNVTNIRRYTAISWTFGGAGSGPTGTFYVALYRA